MINIENIEDVYTEECKTLIAAILSQALLDAIKSKKESERKNATQFIDYKNPIFKMYCELLNVDPEIIFKKMQLIIYNSKNKNINFNIAI